MKKNRYLADPAKMRFNGDAGIHPPEVKRIAENERPAKVPVLIGKGTYKMVYPEKIQTV